MIRLKKTISVQQISILHDPWPGRFYEGQKLLEGYFVFGNHQEVRMQSPLWTQPFDKEFFAYLHGFRWLRDLRTLRGGVSRRLARDLIEEWMKAYPKRLLSAKTLPAETPAILAERLSSWMSLYEFFGASADDDFKQAFVESVQRQLKRLEKGCGKRLNSCPLSFLKALIQGDVFLQRGVKLSLYLPFVEQKLKTDITPEGLYHSQVPSEHLRYIQDLLDIRHALQTARHDVPPLLNEIIRKMAHYMRMLRHGDGKLALFGNGYEMTADVVDSMLSLSHVRGGTTAKFPHHGYYRLERQQGLVLMMHARETKRAAVVGALEYSVGKERLLVSGFDPQHPSTAGTHFHLDAVALMEHQQSLSINASIDEECAYLEGKWAFGVGQNLVQYQRCLYLSPQGNDLRGEEQILTPLPQSFQLQFCLHPALKFQLATTQRGALLYTSEGREWRFQVDQEHYLEVQPAGYAYEQRIVPTQKLVVKGLAHHHHLIRWALREA